MGDIVNYNGKWHGLALRLNGQGAIKHGTLAGIPVVAGPYAESRLIYSMSAGAKPVVLLIGFSTLEEIKNQLASGASSVKKLSIEQLKWWLNFGDKTKPIGLLPHDGGSMENQQDWSQVLYKLRQDDEHGLLLDSASMADIIEDAEFITLDAMVIQRRLLDKRARLLEAIMNRQGRSVTAVSYQISEPFKQKGTTNIVLLYELSDGQTVSIYFHNPDTTPNKITPDDELVSWKWLLNKTDITILVARENGLDLVPREVARRVMALAEKNSKKFQAANSKRAERLQAIADMKEQVLTKERKLEQLENELEQLKAQETPAAPAPIAEEVTEPAPAPELDPVVVLEPASEERLFLNSVISGEYEPADTEGSVGDKLADIAGAVTPDLIELLTQAVDAYASRLNALADEKTGAIELEAAYEDKFENMEIVKGKFHAVSNDPDLPDVVGLQMVRYTIKYFGAEIKGELDTKVMKNGQQIVIDGDGFIPAGTDLAKFARAASTVE